VDKPDHTVHGTPLADDARVTDDAAPVDDAEAVGGRV